MGPPDSNRIKLELDIIFDLRAFTSQGQRYLTFVQNRYLKPNSSIALQYLVIIKRSALNSFLVDWWNLQLQARCMYFYSYTMHSSNMRVPKSVSRNLYQLIVLPHFCWGWWHPSLCWNHQHEIATNYRTFLVSIRVMCPEVSANLPYVTCYTNVGVKRHEIFCEFIVHTLFVSESRTVPWNFY